MANEATSSWLPDWAVPPGEILKEVLAERELTQAELAKRTGRPLKTINEIIKGKAAITPESAIQLERTLGISAHFWMNLETNYRGALARQRTRRDLEAEAPWVDRFPLKEMKAQGLIRQGVSKADTLSDLLEYFRVSSTKAWEATWASHSSRFRKSPSFSANAEPVAAWLRWGELEAERTVCAPFDADLFRTSLSRVRSLIRVEPFDESLAFVRELLAASGVALVLTPEFHGAPVSGAARWISSQRALIQLSLRHKADDQFWFTFFHEAGHILCAERRREFIDSPDGGDDRDPDEREADKFARDTLIPPSDYAAFVAEGEFSGYSVRAFANRLGISPGIVVGRLQRDAKIKPSQLNHLKKRLRWASFL